MKWCAANCYSTVWVPVEQHSEGRVLAGGPLVHHGPTVRRCNAKTFVPLDYIATILAKVRLPNESKPNTGARQITHVQSNCSIQYIPRAMATASTKPAKQISKTYRVVPVNLPSYNTQIGTNLRA